MLTDFQSAFESLTDFFPMLWQCRLFERFLVNDIPDVCDIPTGLGKTFVIVVWLLALAEQARTQRISLPRRLVYVVNRRTVVDQATNIVECVRDRLREPERPKWRHHADVLNRIISSLRALCGSDTEPVVVSTLRGELADNREWKSDPARPAVVVGTIDMIGSKLLFSGYGDRRYWRTHHAGLIGQDTLIIHDEAHLTPAFSEMLRRVATAQDLSDECRPVRILELSATQRNNNATAFQLELEDETDTVTGELVKQRLDANKRLWIHESDTDIAVALADMAKQHRGSRAKVVVYVRSPEDAHKVAKLITKDLAGSDGRVALLTGTIRGYERDRLVAVDPVFRALIDHEVHVAESVFLVSTSAGEVGIDMDADHMICDVTTLDSMIQRIGRVNRLGGKTREARVDVIYTKDDGAPGEGPFSKATAKTMQVLREWVGERGAAEGVLVSPRHLRVLVDELTTEQRTAAFSPKASISPLTDILLDNWSLTSIDSMPGRPEVAEHLHGLTAEPPDTFVAWRTEVRLLAGRRPSSRPLEKNAGPRSQGVPKEALIDWFGACPIATRERLRDSTSRVRAKLAALLDAHRKVKADADFAVVLLDERGDAEWSWLSAIAEKPAQKGPDQLRYRTVVLPVEALGLDEHGMLVAERGFGQAVSQNPEIDVAEADGQCIRAILRQVGTSFSLKNVATRWMESSGFHDEDMDNEVDRNDSRKFDLPEDAAAAFARERSLVVDQLIALAEDHEGEEGDQKATYLLLMVIPGASPLADPERVPYEQTLDDHTRLICVHADRIARALGLPDNLRDALACAAQWHDRGKDRPVWQRYARNEDRQRPLAKSTRYLHGHALGGYRHEFGSLVEAMASRDVRSRGERDLILHLIAAHHGWARPHFDRRAFDHQGPVDPSTSNRRPPTSAENDAAAVEAVQRFARLEQRFGRWSLAWLESLLRCADMAASKRPADSQAAVPRSNKPGPQQVGA